MIIKIAKLLSAIDRRALHDDIHSVIFLYRADIFRVYLFFASLPAVAQIYEYAISDSFGFKPCAWFPFVVMLNIFFPTEQIKPNMSTLRHVVLPLVAMLYLTSICSVFFVYKLIVYTVESKLGDNLYFLLMFVSNSHAIVALFLIGLRKLVKGSPELPQDTIEKVELPDNNDAIGFKHQVTYVLLFSTFMTSDGAEQSSDLTFFRSIAMIIIMLICVLPWLEKKWEFKIFILNLSATYFLSFLLVIGLKDFLLSSLTIVGWLRFILFCLMIVSYFWNAYTTRDMEIQSEAATAEEEPGLLDQVTRLPDKDPGLVSPKPTSSGTPFREVTGLDSMANTPAIVGQKQSEIVKITELPDPVLVISSKPTSPQITPLQNTRKSTWESCSSGELSEVSRPSTDDEEQEARHEADLMPMNIAVYLPDCISYCSLFPADHEFTRDVMVWSWTAAEIIKPDKNDEMEVVAIKCFDTLVARGCIVLSGYDRLSDRMAYKLENSNNVFLDEQHLQLQYRKNLDDNTNLQELEHLSLISKEINQDHFEILKKCNNLKTLLLHKCDLSKLEKSFHDFFLEQKLFTTLDLSCTNIAELPSSVENLSSLKCLDLSRTPIRWLPVSIELLSNLETLILLGCRSLHALPRGLSKLTNLRNLCLDIRLQLNAMPMGIGKLTKLQSLRLFPVGKNDGNHIGELRDMNKLKGSLCICKLENILNEEEVKMTRLCDKQLTEVEFLWSDVQDGKVTIEEHILKNLQPHFGVQKLKIGFFSGGILPDWIGDPRFDQMVSITLSWCKYCERLPTLGELPSLKFLSIIEMEAVVDIDILFCRKLGNKPAFPRLEELSIEGMPNLEKWTKIGGCDFASLVNLSIKYCPKLVSLPQLSHLDSLQHLEISYCDQLACLPKRKDLVKNLVVKECSKLSLD